MKLKKNLINSFIDKGDKKMTTNEMIKYDQIVEYGIATADELNLARNLVDGEWNEVLDKVCYIRTGYRTFEQYIEAEMEEDE